MSFWEDFKVGAKSAEFGLRHQFDNKYQTVCFSRQKAVEYALTHWAHINPEYSYIDGNDCTNFVSQCWTYAGIPVSENWFSDLGISGLPIAPHSWTNAEHFANYMVIQGYCRIVYSSTEAQLGDIIQFYNPQHGWHHSVIITKIDANGDLYYAAHSDPHPEKKLSEVYPSSGEQLRFLCPFNAY